MTGASFSQHGFRVRHAYIRVKHFGFDKMIGPPQSYVFPPCSSTDPVANDRMLVCLRADGDWSDYRNDYGPLGGQRGERSGGFGWSGGMDLIQQEHFTLAGQLDIQNVANRDFAYNWGNPFSGTHFGYPRLISGSLKITFKK